jgi:hypothetical protein
MINREEQMYMEENYNGVTLTTDSINVIQNQIDLVIRNVDLGFTSSLEAFAVFKELEKRFNDAKKQIDTLAYNESEKYDKTFKIGNYQFTRVDGRKQFDFKHIEEWKIAKDNLAEIESKYKSVYENQQKGLSSFNDQTGEVLDVPVVTFSKSSLAVKNK